MLNEKKIIKTNITVQAGTFSTILGISAILGFNYDNEVPAATKRVAFSV